MSVKNRIATYFWVELTHTHDLPEYKAYLGQQQDEKKT